MRAGWSPPPRQDYDFSDGERCGDGGGGRWEVGRGQQQAGGDSWERRRRETGEVRGQLVLAPGENSTTLRVRIREEGAGEEVGKPHTLTR